MSCRLLGVVGALVIVAGMSLGFLPVAFAQAVGATPVAEAESEMSRTPGATRTCRASGQATPQHRWSDRSHSLTGSS